MGVDPQIDHLSVIKPDEMAAALRHTSDLMPTRYFHQDGLIQAAVLIPFLWIDGAWHILFTRRTDHLETHKGQVAFPGGAVDPCDVDPGATALREAYEETGIQPGSVRLIGQMIDMVTITRFLVTPVVGVVEWPQSLNLAEFEVSRVFTVPLGWLADPENVEIKPYLRPNGHIEEVIYFNRYDGEMIWGVTGRIMYDLIQLLIRSQG